MAATSQPLSAQVALDILKKALLLSIQLLRLMQCSNWLNRLVMVCLESVFDYRVIRELIKMNHKICYDVGSYSGYQAIMYDSVNKVYYGASESRKDGQAAGY